jgi:endonuclease III
MEIKQRASLVYQRLVDFFGIPEWQPSLQPLDELVSTILSQNTNDTNRDRAFMALQMSFPSWESVRDAPEEDVIRVIRPAGLANQKGPRIQAVLREITKQRGSLDISFLKTLPDDEVFSWLTSFKGVGPKTASIVMLFSLQKPAFPVDTHIYRVSGRLDLRPQNMDVDETHRYLAEIFDPETYGPAHLNLIRLGREICHARKPECTVCPLQLVCNFPENQPAQSSFHQ